MNFLAAFNNWCGGPGLWHAGGGPGMFNTFPFHFGGIFQLIVIGLIIYFTVRLIRKPDTGYGTPSPQGESPETVLKRRYAAGEIDEQTYKHMKQELNSQQN